MALRLYNTLTRKKELFQPLDPGNVRMYVCGPTVYDFAHIGNARPVIVFDVLFRLLRHLYGADHVTYVRNITDVDDKINARAVEEYPDLPLNKAIRRVTEKTEKQFHDDVAALGCLQPTVEPRATEHIAAMKEMIHALVKSGAAYVAEDHVLFHVATMPDYGKLSGRSLDEMIAGARVEVAPYKRDPMDFVLWKPSKPGEPSWQSPAGIATPGRPGWHIECSAMSWKHLGQTFDIHGGGIDLVFPHHENEIAQSRSAFHMPVMANYWLHNGFLQVEGEKMAKSLDNFVTVHELLTDWRGSPWPGSAIRWAMLQTHYRQPIDWTLELLQASMLEILGVINQLRALFRENGKVNFERLMATLNEVGPSSELLAALSDDLNTPEAMAALRAHKRDDKLTSLLATVGDLRFLGVLREGDLKYLSIWHGIWTDVPNPDEALRLASTYQIARSNDDTALASEVLDQLAKMGLKIEEREPSSLVVMRECQSANFDDYVNSRIVARKVARKAKNYAEADRIRNELIGRGVRLEDKKDPKTGELVTTWEVAR